MPCLALTESVHLMAAMLFGRILKSLALMFSATHLTASRQLSCRILEPYSYLGWLG